MVVLGGGAVSYERGTPVATGNCGPVFRSSHFASRNSPRSFRLEQLEVATEDHGFQVIRFSVATLHAAQVIRPRISRKSFRLKDFAKSHFASRSWSHLLPCEASIQMKYEPTAGPSSDIPRY